MFPGFHPRKFHVRFVTGKMALGQVFPRQCPATTLHSHFIYMLLLPEGQRGEAWEPVNTKVNLNYIQRPRPHRAVNTLRLSYTDQLVMLYSEIIAVCSEIHTKHINTVRTAQ
jgi:hypothetical protein